MKTKEEILEKTAKEYFYSGKDEFDKGCTDQCWYDVSFFTLQFIFLIFL